VNKTILIVDTKAGNLFSLKAAIERLGYSAVILDKPNDAQYAGIVIPGQGRFGTVLKNIRANGWQDYLQGARANNIPMLGICVGMQIFFEASAEDEDAVGFGWFKGKAEALDFPKKPMVGWAELDSNVWPNSIVYFVNSFAIKDSEFSIATTTYGETFVAAIKDGSFTGVQFHPEKSSTDGAEIIRQALNLSFSTPNNKSALSPIVNKLGSEPINLTSSLLPRIIVCLDVDKGRVVKGTNFKQMRDMGDPVELALQYQEQGADELVFLDISATNENRPTALKLVSDIASNLSIPFTVGGGLKRLDDVKAFLDAGADKVALNTTAVLKPEIINQTALAYGSQCVVVAIDVNKQNDELPIFINGGRKLVSNKFFEWVSEVANRGAGEILLTAMHRDGTGLGFDTELTRQVSEQVPIQVIASGGAKNEQHFLKAYQQKADACLAAGMFHSGEYSVGQVKNYLTTNGIKVR
jgi:cyclase